MSDLIAIFDSLAPPAEESEALATFSGTPVPESQQHHTAKDRNGRPAVLIGASSEGPGAPPAIVLQNLRVDHGLQCRVVRPDGEVVESRFSLVHCLSPVRHLHECFLRTMGIVLNSLPAGATSRDVAEAVGALVELFHALQRAPSQSSQGLWAELFLIDRAREPRAMLRAWHASSTERFDFCEGTQRVEAKCASDQSRRHHFSFEQVYPPSGASVLVASLFVKQSVGGTTLGDLWDRVRKLAGDDVDLRAKVDRVCFEALGTSWEDSVSRSYDRELAGQSLAFYDAKDIPRVAEDQPAGVSDIRFRSDLSLANPVVPESVRGGGPLFDACL